MAGAVNQIKYNLILRMNHFPLVAISLIILLLVLETFSVQVQASTVYVVHLIASIALSR